jgi:hypothetical protein
MKRLLWCLCLCSLCPTWVIGCGDDETSSGSEDGGVEQDLEEVNNRIDSVQDELDDLTGNVGGLTDDVSDLDDKFTELTAGLDGRLEDLENPEILSCTEFEVCIPTGVMDVTGGIGGIIDVVCEHEIDCCTENELNLKFGPGIDSVEDCVGLFTNMVENGFSPDFFETSMTPSVVQRVIGVVQALNDPRVRVAINQEGVQACIDSLETECPEISEPGPLPDPECVATTEYEENPCALSNLLIGMQDEGELCGDYSYGYGEDIPECKEGFYCSFEGFGFIEGPTPSQGVCARLPDAGDFCQEDRDCDPFGYNQSHGGPLATNLYCNLADAQCEQLGGEGDPCEFIDDTFTLYDEFNSQILYPRNRSATSRDCGGGLTCDPTSKECVANCSRGRFCDPYNGMNQLATCGEDMLCNVTEEPELYEIHGLGICWPALERGDVCTAGFECEDGVCTDNCNQTTLLCECNEVRAPGEECPTPGPEELCSSGWCGTDGECAAACNCDENVSPGSPGSCDALVGPVPVGCDDGYYCASSTYNGQTGTYACEPLIPNGTACDYTNNGSDNHVACNSGFCDPATTQCAAKVAMDAACPSGVDQQCRSTQYCNNDEVMLCRTYRTAGQTCDAAVECADGLVCVDGAASDTCQPLAGPGDDCNAGNVGAPECDTREDDTIGCIDIDGDGAGLVYQCYSSMGGYADGVECGGNHALCASGWCRWDAATAPMEQTCEQPLEDGDPCDTANPTMDRCGEGLYCARTRSSTMGECAAQSGPGEPCDPFFGGGDCLYDGACVFAKDQYLCDSDSIDYEVELFCDGN